ncbi:MAG: hypothetical protein AMXMBFR84_16410 [Candidatus Hydrogenedentota bacterium]
MSTTESQGAVRWTIVLPLIGIAAVLVAPILFWRNAVPEPVDLVALVQSNQDAAWDALEKYEYTGTYDIHSMVNVVDATRREGTIRCVVDDANLHVAMRGSTTRGGASSPTDTFGVRTAQFAATFIDNAGIHQDLLFVEGNTNPEAPAFDDACDHADARVVALPLAHFRRAGRDYRYEAVESVNPAGDPVITIEVWTTGEKPWKHRTLEVNPRKGYLCEKQTLHVQGDAFFQLLAEFDEVEPGIWFPKRFARVERGERGGGFNYTYTIDSVNLNPPIDPALFSEKGLNCPPEMWAREFSRVSTSSGSALVSKAGAFRAGER